MIVSSCLGVEGGIQISDGVTSRNSDSILIIFSLIYNYAYGLLCNYLCLFVYISGTNLISQHYLPSILPAPDIATADRRFLMITDISFTGLLHSYSYSFTCTPLLRHPRTPPRTLRI